MRSNPVGERACQHAARRKTEPERGRQPRRRQVTELDLLTVCVDPTGKSDLKPDVEEEEQGEHDQQPVRGFAVFLTRPLGNCWSGYRECASGESHADHRSRPSRRGQPNVHQQGG